MRERWRDARIDAEIDSNVLSEKIKELSEIELRSGEVNLIIWLRNQMGNTMEPKLDCKKGYIGIRQLPKMTKGRGDRDVKFSKLLFFIKVDKGMIG